MVFSNVTVNVTIPRRSFVFGQSRAKVFAGFTNLRSLAVAAFDLVYCSLSVSRLSFSLALVSSCPKVVIGLCATRILQGCNIRAIFSEVPLMYGIVAVVTGSELTLVRVLESVLLCVFRVVMVLNKNVVMIISLVL